MATFIIELFRRWNFIDLSRPRHPVPMMGKGYFSDEYASIGPGKFVVERKQNPYYEKGEPWLFVLGSDRMLAVPECWLRQCNLPSLLKNSDTQEYYVHFSEEGVGKTFYIETNQTLKLVDTLKVSSLSNNTLVILENKHSHYFRYDLFPGFYQFMRLDSPFRDGNFWLMWVDYPHIGAPEKWFRRWAEISLNSNKKFLKFEEE